MCFVELEVMFVMLLKLNNKVDGDDASTATEVGVLCQLLHSRTFLFNFMVYALLYCI